MSRLPAICTIASYNYLASVRVLTQSFLEFHPESRVFLCLLDHADKISVEEDFTVISADSLGIPNWNAFAFKYNALELSTALKPFVIDYLFNTYGYEKLIYFDCDVVIYSPLDEIDALLDEYGLILTPHLLAPINDTLQPSETDIALSGIYNLGFLAISRQTNVTDFLVWWKDRLYDRCIVAPDKGINCDQRWMDFAPGLFDKVYILRDASYNLAYWNFAQRELSGEHSPYTVSGKPVKFIHYSGFVPENPLLVSRYQNRLTTKNIGVSLRSLLLDYRQRLFENGYDIIHRVPYAYAAFDNGIAVPRLAQIWYRTMTDSQERWQNPFRTGPDSYFGFLKAPSKDGLPAASITDFMIQFFTTYLTSQKERPTFSLRARLVIAAQILLGNTIYDHIRSIYKKLRHEAE